jgi:hypothetical protein
VPPVSLALQAAGGHAPVDVSIVRRCGDEEVICEGSARAWRSSHRRAPRQVANRPAPSEDKPVACFGKMAADDLSYTTRCTGYQYDLFFHARPLLLTFLSCFT